MQLIQWDAARDVESFFEDFPVVAMPRFGWDVSIDMYEKDGELVVKAHVPGIDPERMEVTVEDSVLRIAGSREEGSEDRGTHYYNREIRRGSFERFVRLPKEIDRSRISAECTAGTLVVTAPVVERLDRRVVEVQVRK